MRAGCIYFAQTSSPYIKVGRFFAHISVAEKEAVYKRLDPDSKSDTLTRVTMSLLKKKGS